eukprot:TRINITY_DN3053_c0_g1_i1.p1 TRINITY_DN3053_c0_g1~~TRINITY_DN3053_c0_g1_i1.p1  ORF type:complete len:212 (-),score=65.12 TRINITY_DN3053_c0_g1_i1:243-878(-)
MMMKFVFVIFLILNISFVFSQEACCTPKQWQGFINGVSRTGNGDSNHEYIINQHIDYDYTNKMARVDTFETDFESVVVQTIIERYDLGQIFIIDQVKNECAYFNVKSGMPEACIYDGYNFAFEFTLGINLECVAYDYLRYPNFNDQVVVTKQGCYPVSGVLMERFHSNKLGYLFNYHNITDGIDDPFVFENPSPSACTEIPAPENYQSLLN